jgi:hopanoid biosynthesis associated protein HpnK
MKKLIVNADDFGLHEEINKGIIKGYQEGFVTSTSLMCSAPAFENAVALAKENPGLGIGIHLTLVGSVPSVLPKEKISSLVNDKGLFPENYVAFAKMFYTGQVKMVQLELELRAQIEKALATGLNITHVDSHQHTHVLPGMTGLVVKLCNEYKIKNIRIPQEGYFFSGGFAGGLGRKIGRAGLSFCACLAAMKAKSTGLAYPESFFGMLAGGNLNETLVGNIITALPEGVSEIMTHPGLNKQELDKHFTWNYHWEDELQAFLSDKNKNLLEQHKVALINFGGLR